MPIPFEEIRKIIDIQPFVRAGEFTLWNEIYHDYAWVRFGSKGSSLSIAILPDERPITQKTAQRLTFYDIVH